MHHSLNSDFASHLPAAPAVVFAFIRSNVNKQKTIRCMQLGLMRINPRKPLVTLHLAVTNGRLPFLNSKTFISKTLRLDGATLPLCMTGAKNKNDP